jgi:type IV secretion system protein VirD4
VAETRAGKGDGPGTHLSSSRSSAIRLGRRVDADGTVRDKLLYDEDRHVLLFGPNGTGKGTRLLVPNLLQIKDRSLLVIDPKGELAAITAPYRRTLGKVVILNPFGVLTDIPGYEDLVSDGYNPLTSLNPASPSFNADASWLAEALINVGGKDPHWGLSARKLVSALIMYVRATEGQRGTLARVRELLAEPVVLPDKDSSEGSGIPITAIQMIASGIPALRNKAGQFTEWNKEIQSILSTADTQTEALDDPEIAADLSRPGVDFRELKTQPMTVYVILPPDMMERQSRWLRLILSAALRAVMRARRKGEMPVTFIMDEFAALGHLPIIETTWALVRGYGIQLLPVLQDLNQLKALYKERWETFIGMAGATIAFGPNDLTTAEWMSRRGGEATAVAEGYSTSFTNVLARRDANKSYQQIQTRHLPVHGLLDTPEGRMHLWLAGVADTIPVYAPMYVDIRECLERARSNPYYQPEET